MRIPIIQATEELKQIPVTATTQGAGRTWKAVEQLSGQVQDIGLDIEERKKRIKMYTDLSEIEMDMQKTNEDLVLKLRSNPDPDNYFSDWNSGFSKLGEERIKNIKSPETRMRAQVAVKGMQTRELVEQKHYGNKLFIETMQAKTERLLDYYEKKGDLESGQSLIEEVTLHGIYSPIFGEKRKQEFAKGIETQRIKSLVTMADGEIFQTPDKTDEILQKEIYNDIPDDKKMILMNKGVTRSNSLERQIEKNTKDFSEQIYGDLKDRIRKGEDVNDLIHTYGPAGERMIVKEHFDGLLNETDSISKAGTVSDSDVALDVSIRSNTAIPQISEGEITSLMKSRKLSRQDGEKALDQVRTTNRTLQNEAMALVNQEYVDAEKYIREGMGISGLILELQEKIDPTKQGLIARANAELRSRSKGRGGNENPMDVATEILPKYQKALSGQNLLSIETYEKLIEIDKYPDQDVLHNAFVNGEIKEQDYYRKVKAFKEMVRLLAENQSIKNRNEFESGRKK